MTFTVPLSIAAHQAAQTLRQLQANPRKAKQVYLNTLAVEAVHQYLQYLDIATDLAGSDSRDRILASLTDSADLVLPGLGRLECRFVLPDAHTMQVPREAWDNRIGYVAVRLDADLSQATLLGFVPTVSTEEVAVEHLRSLTDLIQHLAALPQTGRVPLSQWFSAVTTAGWKTLDAIATDLDTLLDGLPLNLAYRQARQELAPRSDSELESGLAPDSESSLAPDLESDRPPTIPVLLDLLHSRRDKWTRLQVLDLLGNVAVGDAEAIATLTDFLTTTQDEELSRQAAVSLGKISPSHPQAAIRRARLIELGLELQQQRFVLVLTLGHELGQSEESEQVPGVDVHLRLYPVNGTTLPIGLRLSVLDDLGEAFLEVQSAADDWLQLQFSGSAGDRFALCIALDAAQVTEEFVI